MSAPEVTILSTSAEKDAIAPALAKLAAPTEMSSYEEEQWKFLLEAGDVQALVVAKPDSRDELLGSLLRIGYGPDYEAFGMMLVSKQARRQGLAKKLLNTALADPKHSMKILAACSEAGRPLYEKLGFRRVGTVTRMSVKCDKLEPSNDDLVTFHMDEASHFPKLLEMDLKATGLDRSKTLNALYGYSYVKMATLTKDGSVVAAALVTQHISSSLASVGPILGQEDCVLALLQGVRTTLPATAMDLALIVSDHPSLVQTLTEAGFDTAFQVGAMTMNGQALPGQRDQYIGLIHPTLG